MSKYSKMNGNAQYLYYSDGFWKVVGMGKNTFDMDYRTGRVTIGSHGRESINVEQMMKMFVKEDYVGRYGFKKESNCYEGQRDDTSFTNKKGNSAPVFVLYNTSDFIVYLKDEDVQSLIGDPKGFDAAKICFAPAQYAGADKWEYVSDRLDTKYADSNNLVVSILRNAERVSKGITEHMNGDATSGGIEL